MKIHHKIISNKNDPAILSFGFLNVDPQSKQTNFFKIFFGIVSVAKVIIEHYQNKSNSSNKKMPFPHFQDKNVDRQTKFISYGN